MVTTIVLVRGTTMTIEAAVVVDHAGRTLGWHLPPGRSSGGIPDDRDHWLFLWENRSIIGGVAHTHPWDGPALASREDETTWAALEAALGQRYVWPVVTFTHAAYYHWVGPEKLMYIPLDDPPWLVADIEILRNISR